MAQKKVTACVGIEIVGNIMNIAVLTKNKGYVIVEELPERMLGMGTLIFEKDTSKQLKEMFKKNNIKIRDCSLVLPDGVAIVKTLEIGAMPSANIYKALPLEFQEQGAGPDFIYDYAVTGVNRNGANEVTGMRILGMGVDEDNLLDQKDIFKAAGLNLFSATCRENALINIIKFYRGISDDLDNQESFCFIEIGYKNTKLHFFKGMNYELTRGLEYGVTHIEQAISRSLSVPIEKAQEHLCNSVSVDIEQLDAVDTMYSLLSKEIKQTITFYNSNSFGNHVSEALCIGDGTRVPTMINAISRSIASINVTLDTAANRLSHTLDISGEHFDKCAVAIGAALQI